MKKKIVMGLFVLTAVIGMGFADDELTNCTSSEIQAGIYCKGNGYAKSSTVETCTNSDNTERKITTTSRENYGISIPGVGFSRTNTTTATTEEYRCPDSDDTWVKDLNDCKTENTDSKE